MECAFCRIVSRPADAVVIYEDAEVLAFLDRGPLRPGHAQVIPKAHYETFDLMPTPLAARVLAVGQRVAARQKAVYGVARVAFLFTGGDVPHAHAHVVPMHEKTDITSARYLVSPDAPRWSADHLYVARPVLERVRADLGEIVLD